MAVRLRDLLFWRSPPDTEALTDAFRRLDGTMHVDCDGRPIELDVGGRILRLYPETGLGRAEEAPKDWILVDGERHGREICGFARIARGNRFLVGRDNEDCQRLFGFKSPVRKRHLEITNENGQLGFKRLDAEAESYIRCVDDSEVLAQSETRRLQNLERVRAIFGGPIALLPPGEALATLTRVNRILRNGRYRKKNSQDKPGGLVDLPDTPVPVIVGDLHARIDNLLKVLSEDAYLDALARGDACLILLGDTVHSELDGELEQMDSSLMMLDLILKLMVRFPDNVIYLRGNHEVLDEEVGKDGVPQGILFRKRARELRGKSYVKELEAFFELLPYVIRSRDFIACHAGPPRGKTAMRELVEIGRHPKLARALTWNRLKGARAPAGYRKKDVKAFRACLDVDKKTPFIVSHNPQTREETLWTDVGEIPNHHIVFSALTHKLALFIRVGREMVPLEYPAAALLDLTNSLEPAEEEIEPAAAQ